MKKLLVIIITIMTSSSSFADLDVNGNIVLGSEIKASDFNTRFSVIKTKFNNKGLDLLNNQSNPDSAINFDLFAEGGTEDVSKTKILDQLSKIPLETNGINTLSNEISSNELNLWFNFLENLADTYQPPIACTQTEAILNGVNNSNVTSYTGTYSGDDYTNCLIEQCENNYSKSLDEKSCIEDTRACLVSDLINQTGVETVSGNYGLATNDSSNCTIDTCQTEFNLNNDVCEPAIIPDTPLNINYKNISLGNDNSFFLNPVDEKVYSWGSNNSGQLGIGLNQSSQLQSLIPIAVDDSLLGQAKMISAYSGHVCAIKASNNKVYCWGRRFNGSIGDGSTQQFVNVSTPSLIDDSLLDAASQLDVSNTFSCAIKNSDNQLFCWGGNGDGQLGDGTQNNRFSPRAVDQTNL